jgi:hypothetical protein
LHIGVRVVAGQRLPPLLGIMQVTGKFLQCHLWSCCGVRRDQGQRQRESGATGDDFLDSLGLGAEASGADALVQQLLCLLRRQQVEVDQVGGGGGD